MSPFIQIIKTINFCLSDQNGILLHLVFSDLGDVVNGRQGVVSCLLEFRSLSSAVESATGEFYVLRCHSGNLRHRAKILTSRLYLSVKYT
jgi:hypothetical protein